MQKVVFCDNYILGLQKFFLCFLGFCIEIRKCFCYYICMENKIVYIPVEQAIENLICVANKNNFSNLETIKWIVVKVLRLKREQFDKIARISTVQLEDMITALKRHIAGETLGKIFGFIEFYGNFFNVTENVFDPRLSTEALVDAVINCESAKKQNVKIIDLCTGSGCVAITISKILRQKIDAIDISPLALEIARENNQKNNASVNFFEMDLNQDWRKYLNQKYDIIVSNPPYWNAEKILKNINVVADNPLAGFDGGEDGLHFIKRIIETAPQFLNGGGELFLEIEPDQENNIRKMLEKSFCKINTFLDYRKITRVISAKLK